MAFAAALVLTLLALQPLSSPQAQETAVERAGIPVPVTVRNLGSILIDRSFSAPAQVVPANRSELAAELAAVVDTVHFDVGAQVGQGDGFISDDDLLARETELDVAKAEKATAEVALAEAREALERTTIEAPFAGTINERLAQAGGYVVPGTLRWIGARGQLPADLVVRRGDAFGVFLDEGGIARFVELPNAGKGGPVATDLPDDTRIVVTGANALQDGDPLDVSMAGAQRHGRDDQRAVQGGAATLKRTVMGMGGVRPAIDRSVSRETFPRELPRNHFKFGSLPVALAKCAGSRIWPQPVLRFGTVGSACRPCPVP